MVGSDTPLLAVDIEKHLGGFHLQARIAVQRREVLVLFGHSGSGKSLTLRAIAGLLRPDLGRIAIDGQTVFDSARRIDVPPQGRGVGMVVQSYALFPHMTVAQNIGFGLHGRPVAERRARVEELLRFLGIKALAERRPDQISGGQAQRVALARALAPRPPLLLLDEPFSALDNAIRVTLRRELTRLTRELNLTVLFVTHDLREAYNLAGTIAVFDGGRVLQHGPRDEVFARPVSARVAELTEVRNIWRGHIVAVDGSGVTADTGRFLVRADLTPRPPSLQGRGNDLTPQPPSLQGRGSTKGAAEPVWGWAEGMTVDICIRPERVLLLRTERRPPGGTRDTVVAAEIVDEVAHGASHTLFFRLAGHAPERGYDVEVDVPAHPYEVLGVRDRRTWDLAFPREAVHLMPPG